MKADSRPAPRLAWRAVAVALLFAAGACQGEQSTQGNAPAAEVLPGSASDAMLPIDTVRSQPPLAPHSEAAGAKVRDPRARASGEAPGDEASEAAPSASSSAPASAASAAAE